MAQFRVEFVLDQATGKYLAELYNPETSSELMVRTEALYPVAGGRGARGGAALQGRDPEVPARRGEARDEPKQKRRRTDREGQGGEEGQAKKAKKRRNRQEEEARMHCSRIAAGSPRWRRPAFADFNDKKPINATVTGATPSGYPRTMVEGLNAVVRDAYPGSAVSFKPNSPGGGVLAIAEGQADFTATATGTEIRLANEGQAPFKQAAQGQVQLRDAALRQPVHPLPDDQGMGRRERHQVAGPTSRRRSRACASPSTAPTTRRPPSAGPTR